MVCSRTVCMYCIVLYYWQMMCSRTTYKRFLEGWVGGINHISLRNITCVLPLYWEQHLSHNSLADEDCDKSAILSMEIKETSCILHTAKYYPNRNNSPSMHLITIISNHQTSQSKSVSWMNMWLSVQLHNWSVFMSRAKERWLICTAVWQVRFNRLVSKWQ
jgi:hypothetical protein